LIDLCVGRFVVPAAREAGHLRQHYRPPPG
jgi:hypothetical protein